MCDIKSIQSVIAMIPQRVTLPSGQEGLFYCMMEKPGLDISDLEVPYVIYSDSANNDNDSEDVE